MIQAIIFDLDDTLYPEQQFVISGFSHVSNYLSKRYDFEQGFIFDILINDFKNGIRKKNFNILLKKLDLEDELLEEIIICYREHQPSLSLYSDAKNSLNTLINKFKLGMITDGYYDTQQKKIEALQIEEYFDIIIINDISKGISKMKKEPFVKALDNLGVEPEETIYIGDNPQKDFIKSNELGIITVRIKRENSEYCKIIADGDYEADYIISNLLELNEIIKRI
ncbi:MAG: HAD family hydrolase [Methanobacterium sp.]